MDPDLQHATVWLSSLTAASAEALGRESRPPIQACHPGVRCASKRTPHCWRSRQIRLRYPGGQRVEEILRGLDQRGLEGLAMSEALAEGDGAGRRGSSERASTVALALPCGRPDGDALGSMLALHHLCRSPGARQSVASWSDPFVVAPHYRFLPGLEGCTKPGEFPARPEVMMTPSSCGSPARLGRPGPSRPGREELRWSSITTAPTIRYGTINVVDPEAAASAPVLVRRLAGRLGWALTRDAALCFVHRRGHRHRPLPVRQHHS